MSAPTCRKANGPVAQRALELAAEGCHNIRRVMAAEGFKDQSVKSALDRLRAAGEIPRQRKAVENRYQIRIHPAASAVIIEAASEKGIKPGTLAKIMLNRAARDLQAARRQSS